MANQPTLADLQWMFFNDATESGVGSGNADGVLLASAARATGTAVSSSDITNRTHTGLFIFVDCTAETATASITIAVHMKDSISGEYSPITPELTAFDATGNYVYFVGPAAAANTALKGVQQVSLPRVFKVVFTPADSDSMTYSASYSLVV